MGLHEVLHVELVRPALAQIGHAEVKPLCVSVRVDVERQLEVVFRPVSAEATDRGADCQTVTVDEYSRRLQQTVTVDGYSRRLQ